MTAQPLTPNGHAKGLKQGLSNFERIVFSKLRPQNADSSKDGRRSS